MHAREPISVLALFRLGRVEPVRFRRGEQTYDVTEINLFHNAQRGRDEILYFSVFDGTQSYRLAYEVQKKSWFLEEESWL